MLNRVNAIALDQVSALRRRLLVDRFARMERAGILVMLGSSIDRLPSGEPAAYRSLIGPRHGIPPDILGRIKTMRTHLNRFSEDEAEVVMYHGYLLTDAVLWSRREHLPERYRRPDGAPAWQISFGAQKTTSVLKALDARSAPLALSTRVMM